VKLCVPSSLLIPALYCSIRQSAGKWPQKDGGECRQSRATTRTRLQARQGRNRSKQVGHVLALPTEGPPLPTDIHSHFPCFCAQQLYRLTVSGDAISEHSVSTSKPILAESPFVSSIHRSAISRPGLQWPHWATTYSGPSTNSRISCSTPSGMTLSTCPRSYETDPVAFERMLTILTGRGRLAILRQILSTREHRR
jgi:hypothetical protein